MTGPHPEELLAAYVDGDLADDDRRVVDDHVAACARCADEVALARRARDAMAALEPAPAPLGLGTPAIQRARASRRADRLRWVAGAAAAAVVLAVGVVVVRQGVVGQLGSGQDAGSAEDAPAPGGEGGGGGEPTPLAAPRFLRTGNDYTAEDLQAIVRGSNGDALTSSEYGARALNASDLGEAADCIDRAGLEAQEGAELLSVELARFEGDPAYVVLFRREDTTEIWAVDRDACEIRYAATSRG